jgi:hypothetical protein
MARDEYHFYDFKTPEPYEKGGKQFTFSYEDHKNQRRTYRVEKTDNPASVYNIKIFWDLIKKFRGKSEVPNIFMGRENSLLKMKDRGLVKIVSVDKPKDPLQLELPLDNPTKEVTAHLEYIMENCNSQSLVKVLSYIKNHI